MTMAAKPEASARQLHELSHAQRGVWLDARLIDDPAAYQIGAVASIKGEVDLGIARQAVRVMMGQHDALRLRVDRAEPRQWLEAGAPPPFRGLDLSEHDDPAAAFEQELKSIHAEGFKLGEEPLFKVVLAKLADDDWRMIVLCHHLLADGVSILLSQRHWLMAYNALAGEAEEDDDGEGEREAAPRSSYLPIVRDDAAYEASPRYGQDMAHWLGRLSPLPPLLFSDRPSPSVIGVQSASGEIEPLVLDAAFLARLEAAARGANTTVHRALLAVLAVTLARRYGRDDLAIGMALHRRDFASRNTIGMLAGMIAVRMRIGGDAGIGACVSRLAADIDADMRHQRTPIDALGRALAAEGAFGGSTPRGLFDVAVTMLPAIREALPSLAGAEVSSRPLRGRENTPLALYVNETADPASMSVAFRFDPSVLTGEEVARIRDLFGSALSAFVETPARRISTLDRMTDGEARSIAAWSKGTEMPIPDGTLPDLFEAVAERQGEAVAVVGAGGTLTYGELDRAANRVAARILGFGAEAGAVIGVAVPRSLESVPLLLGILKAGCVYLPLDPAYPDDRLAGMIADSGARLVFALPELIDRLPAEATAMMLEDGWPMAGANARRVARATLTPDSRAYVIYTSGSTGRPKGVSVSHRALINLAVARQEHDPIGPGDRILAAISIGFDVSLGQLLTPLLSGATVVVAEDIRGISSSAFWSFMEKNGVTHVNSVPSFFESVLADAPRKTSLKQVMLGGEPLSGALAARLGKRLGGVRVVNMYGPTEACIDTTAFPFPGDGMETQPVLPIGRPMPNYSTHILDDDLQPVPIGREGELFIGGPSLAEGYLGLPEQTRERFIAHPVFGRLYRSGDRVVWREDGAIAFRGRADSQVKIRGFRVELGEIEIALATHPALARAAVVAKATGNGDLRLLGYAVPRTDGDAPSEAELRDFLARTLPSHMVPSAITLIPDLPLTANGKLDERALPDPFASAEAPRGAPPTTSTETFLASCFAMLLGVEGVTVDSHFFELGGHSLMATQLASRLSSEFGIELPLRDLFEAPRLGELATRVDALLMATPAAVTAKAIEPIAVEARPDAIPLSYEQERLWFLHQLDPRSAAYNIPVVLRLDGPLDLAALKSAFGRLVARHEVLRTRFVDVAGETRQEILAHEELSFTVDDLSASATEAIWTHAREEALRPFDLSGEPLIRIRVLRLGPATHMVLVTMHHIVSDGWSVGILQRELAAHYVAAVGGPAEALPTLSIQYADYALWQRRHLGPEEVERQVAFWRGELSGAPELLTLPLDHPRPLRRSSAGASCEIAVDAALSAAVTRFARSHNATPFIVLTAAWAALMARWSGQDEVVVGAPIANRGKVETQGLIGFFVNTIALRADLSGAVSFEQLVGRMRGRAMEAYSHADLPFEQVVDALNPMRAPGVNPLFQTAVAVQPAPAATMSFGGLTATAVPLPETAAKFDLTLVVNEGADGFTAGITYALDLFAPQTAQRLAQQFRHFLEGALTQSDKPVDTLPLADAAARQVLVEASRTQGAPAEIDTIPALFERQVARTPEAEAVRFGAASLSFSALNARVHRLAQTLVERGVKVGDPVGVVLGRSEALPVAALGIMKAGAIYVPVDPAHPVERIAGMLYAVAPALVLVEQATATRVDASLPTLDVADIAWDETSEVADAPLPAILASDPAYIIHTSGSTGRPKGVMVSHAALANLAAARLGHDPIGPGDRVLATLSVSFDVSIGQLVTPLLNGATVVVCGEVAAMSCSEFWSLIVSQGITHLNSGPAFFDVMLETPPLANLPLRRLMLGGEAFPLALARRLRAALPDTEIFNMYGPTEACIDATAYRFTGDETQPVLPIGRALPHYRVLVLDGALNPVPPGAVGEIHIGGPSVAIGYRGLPEETAARFVPDPFGQPGDRLYRTGDLARLSADGQIHFLGRSDQQVKIRGFRIELEETASVLRAHPGVRSAAVVTADRRGEKVLVAYAVPEADEADAAMPALWRRHLEERLPSHMVPTAIIAVPALPMTVNGKLDLRALPAPEFDDADDGDETPPRDGLDEALMEIWRELLAPGRLGIDSNFFRLGGHSLQALRLAAACKTKLGVEVPIAAIYEHQTIRALADSIRSGKAMQARGPLVQLGKGEGRPVFCFHPVGGASFGYRGLAEKLERRRPVYGVQASGLEAGEPLAATVESMMDSYLSAIRARQPSGPYSLMGHSFGGLAAFEITRRLELMGETVDRLVMIDTSPAGEPWTMKAAEDTARIIVELERARSATPNAPIDPAQQKRVTDIVANNMRLSQSYQPSQIRTPMIYLYARRGDQPNNGRQAYWEAFSAQPLAYPAMECDHFQVLNRENVSKLAVLFE